MYYHILLEFVATFLLSYLFQTFRQHSLSGTNEYGRIATYNPPPPPPPQLHFPASVDSSDEYFLRHLSTITVPPSLLFASIDPSRKLAKTDTSYLLVNSVPRFFNGIFYRLVRISSWILSTAVAILFATLRVLFAIGPLALVAYALQDSYALRKNLDAVAQALQDIHEQTKAGEDRIRQLEITVTRQEDAIKQREATFYTQQTRSQEATEKLEMELKSAQEHIDGLLATIQNHFQVFQERATAQTQAEPSHYSSPPAPTWTRIPQAQMGMQAQSPAH
ncbi:hypothetical protein MMC29_005315, partial [Sticta canariensis]|nr:hypothetical protein [Sticta canariensis]